METGGGAAAEPPFTLDPKGDRTVYRYAYSPPGRGGQGKRALKVWDDPYNSPVQVLYRQAVLYR